MTPLVLLIAVPFAVIFLGGLAVVWCAGERIVRVVRRPRAWGE
jgi:hypothetical protein